MPVLLEKQPNNHTPSAAAAAATYQTPPLRNDFLTPLSDRVFHAFVNNLTSGHVWTIRDAELTAPISFRDLFQLWTKALGVEHQGASVAAQ